MDIGKVLFLPWPAWAKLSFVLGGLLMLVLLFASVMKIRNLRRIIRLEQRTAVEQAERGENMQTTYADEEIPFGIKALEEEPAIEGVWNARTATPLHTPPGSRGLSPRLGPSTRWQKNKRGSSISSISKLDIQGQVPYPSNPAPETAPPLQGRDQNPPPLTKRKKASSITISYSGPSNRLNNDTKCTLCDSDYTGLLVSGESEGPQPKLRLQTSPKRAGSLRRRFVIGGHSTPYTTQHSLEQEDQSAIDRMDAHRKLHLAEHGQLIPRARRHTTELPDNLHHETIVDDSASPLRTLSWPTREDSIRLSQKIPRKAERRLSPPTVPHHASIESLPPSKAPPSAWTNRTQELLKDKLSETCPARTVSSEMSSTTSSSTLATTTAPTDSVSIASTQKRKVNDSFEILPAGTLEKDPTSKILGLWPTVPKVKNPHKLQKRVRSSSVSSAGPYRSINSEGRRSQDPELRQTVF